MSEGLTDTEWTDVLATLPEDPETAEGWEFSLVRRTVERIVAAREARAAEQALRDAAEAFREHQRGLSRQHQDLRPWTIAHGFLIDRADNIRAAEPRDQP